MRLTSLPPTLFLTNLFLTSVFGRKSWHFRLWIYILYYPYYFLRVRGKDRKTQSPLVGPDWVIDHKKLSASIFDNMFCDPSLSNFCQKIIYFQFFEMELTFLPPIWTMSLNILFVVFKLPLTSFNFIKGWNIGDYQISQS